MLFALSLLIGLVRSYLIKQSIFFIDYKISDNSIEIQSNLRFDLMFYNLKNEHNESFLEPIYTSNTSIHDHFSKDDFHFVIGQNQNQITYAGVYQKNTSDIFMTSDLDSCLSQQSIDAISNFSNLPKITNISDILTFITRIRAMINEFNCQTESNITESEPQEQKLKYFMNKITNTDDDLKKLFEAGQNINISENKTLAKPDSLFPLLYLKIKNDNSPKFNYDLNYYIDGIFQYVVPFYFVEMRGIQINVSQLIKNSNSLISHLTVSLLITVPLILKINEEVISRLNLRYFYTISYELTSRICLNLILDPFEKVDSFKKLQFLIQLFRAFKYVILFFSLRKPLDDMFENEQYFYCSISNFLITAVASTIKAIFDDDIENLSKFMIFQVSTILIPHIVFNMLNSNNDFKLTLYLIILTYIRLYEMSYYFLNIKINANKMFNIAVFIVSIQSFLLILQNLCFEFMDRKKINKNKKDDSIDIIEKTNCAICYSEVCQDSKDCFVTPCNHLFHKNCIHKWMKIKMNCPICRGKLKPIPTYPSFL